MSLTSSEMSPADIAAVNGNNNSWGGDGAWWLLVLFLFCFMGWGGRGMQPAPAAGGGGAIPYMQGAATQADIQGGFDHAAVVSGLNGISSAMNTGFSNAEVSRCNSQANVLQQLGNNHSDVMQQFSNLAYSAQGNAGAIQQGISDLKYIAAQENCADRNAMNTGFQQLEASIGNKTQAILDKMCQQELEAYKRENDSLRQQLAMASLTASQGQQTANINGNTNQQVASAVNQLRTPAPVPAYVVPNPAGCNCGFSGGCCGAA